MLMVGSLAGLVGSVRAGREGGFHDDFISLENWEPLTFPMIRHSGYRIVKQSGGTVLRAESSDSASGLVSTNAFSPYEYPVLRWRWRIENVYDKGDAASREGDDFPLRVYVLFPYNPDESNLRTRIRFNALRAAYGRYPPVASLCYIWANRPHKARIIDNPVNERTKFIVLRTGEEDAGRWLIEEVNVVNDYRAAFGTEPRRDATLGIMNDSDNTGETSVSFLDFIELRRER